MEGSLIDWILDNTIATMNIVMVAITPVIALWAKRFFDQKDKKNDPIEPNIISGSRLQIFAEDLRDQLDAIRVNVWLFHNGGNYYTGMPIQKISMIAEANAPGIKPIIDQFQGHPVALHQRRLEQLVDKSLCEEYNELQYHDALAAMNQIAGAVSSGAYKINNRDGFFSGLIGIAWDDHHKMTDGELELTKLQAINVQNELNKSKN